MQCGTERRTGRTGRENVSHEKGSYMGQHYVARFYLKSWAQDGMLYCLNLKKRKVLHRGLRGIANEKFFYKLLGLTAQERQLIEKVAVEPFALPMQQVQKTFIELCCFPLELHRLTETTNLNPQFKAALEDVIANSAENYHARIENSMKQFVSRMMAGDADFYSDPQEAAEFLYAICVQFTRTKRAREAALSQIGAAYKGCDIDRVWSVLNHLVAASVAYNLYANRNNFRLLLVENTTDTPFVTSDQPIINLHATLTRKPPDKLEFFYPLSPGKAMLLADASPAQNHRGALSSVAVNGYNLRMVKNAYEQVFSDSRDYLDTMNKSYVHSFETR
jgi:Protein of unknown function (DUF4238)